MASDTPLLQITRLSRRFDSHQAVRCLNLRLAPGDRLGLHGPNGSGKSTILRCVAGTLLPTDGSVAVAGHPAHTSAAQRVVGNALSLERAFYLRLTGHENLMTFARLRGLAGAPARSAVAALESELQIEEIAAQRVDRCSSGMMQQLALARALLADPALIVLDEPTRSLDTDAVARLWGALDRRPGLAVLLASHREEDLSRCGSRVELPV